MLAVQSARLFSAPHARTSPVLAPVNGYTASGDLTLLAAQFGQVSSTATVPLYRANTGAIMQSAGRAVTVVITGFGVSGASA